MDKKSTITMIVVMLALTGVWFCFRLWAAKSHPEWFLPPQTATDTAPATKPTTAPTSESSTQSMSSATGPASRPLTQSVTRPATVPSLADSSQWTVLPATRPVRSMTLGSTVSNDPHYSLALALTPKGAAVASVTLNRFRQRIGSADSYVFQRSYAHPVEGQTEQQTNDSPNRYDQTNPLATYSVTIDGKEIELWNADWALIDSGETSARYSVEIGQSGKAALRLIKTYRIHPKDDQTLGYSVDVDFAMENLSGQAMTVKMNFNGPTMPPKEAERGADRVIWAGFLNKDTIVAEQHPSTDFTKEKLTLDLTKSSKGLPAEWAGAGNVYFQSFVLPLKASNGATAVISNIAAVGLDPDVVKDDTEPVKLSFTTTDFHLAAGASVTLPLNVYFGPKWREVLDKPYYNQLPRMYDKSLVVSGGWCGICAFSWLINLLVLLLGFFHYVLRDWGLAIIALVIFVRLLLHPITKRSQVSMMSMGKMGPEIERLKKKHGDDKEALNKAMMEFYKTQGMTPVLGCLPMFLQMPIWIALWEGLQSTFELRQAPFLFNLTWIHDLSKPDALVHFAHPLPLMFGFTLRGINLLPLLMAVVTFFSQKFMPQPLATTPEQKQQQKMMRGMSLIFPLFFYALPSGLNLYYLTSTSLGILEGKIVRDHVKKKEELEKSKQIVIDAKPTRASKGREEVVKKPTGIIKWFGNLQEKVDEVRRQKGK